MIFISPAGARTLSRTDGHPSQYLNKHTIGKTTVYYSNEYSVSYSNNEIQIYYGTATHQDELVDLGLVGARGAHNLFPRAVGPFFFVKITLSEIEIYNSLLRTIDLFYRNSSDGFELSTELSLILDRTPNDQIQVDINYCVDFLLGNCCYGGETPFHGVNQVIMGARYSFKDGAVSRDFIPPSAVLQGSSESITSMLETNIETISKKFKKIKLSFSGGLDSSFILAVMSIKKVDFVANHYLPAEGERSTEVSIAEDYCKLFNITLNKIESEDAAKLASPTTILANSPGDVPFFEKGSNRFYPSEYCSINGHGGDDVFLQNPPYMIGADVMRKSGIKIGLIKLVHLAALKKLNFHKLLLLNILTFSRIWNKYLPYIEYPLWLPRGKSIVKQQHPLLDDHYRGSAKFNHIRRILSSLYSTKQGQAELYCSFSPLLFQNIVAFMSDQNCEDTYDAQHDRLLLRKELSKLIDAPIVSRTQKRPSTDLIFGLLHDNAKAFHDYLIDGRMVKLLKIDAEKLARSINSNTETGLTDDLQFLIRLYQLESYFDPCPDFYFTNNSK